MAKKKKGEQPQREMTKRQLSHWQQQKRRQRIIFISGVSIISAVLLLLVVGLYINQYRPFQETAIKVGDTRFNMRYYIDTLKLVAKGQPQEQLFFLADNTIAEIERNELIRQGALSLNTTASDDEVREEVKTLGLPLDRVTRDIARSQVLQKKLRDEYFDKQVPKSADQVHIMAMLLESENQTLQVRDRLEKGEDFATLANELSLNPLTKDKKGDLGWHTQDVLNGLLGSTFVGDYAFRAEVGALSQPIPDEESVKAVGYWLVKVLDRDDNEGVAHLSAMLLGSEDEAKSVKARLEKGEDFATLAKELSQLSGVAENGGNLEAVSRDAMTAPLKEFVFNPDTKLDTLSQPIRDTEVSTKGGFWLVKILEKQSNRDIAESDRDLLKSKALNEWVASLLTDPTAVDHSFLTDEKKAWAVSLAMQG